MIRQILNHITGYFHWAQTLKFGGMWHWKKTSYPLTNQGIFGDNQFPINQDQSWLLSNFVKVFFYNNFGWMSVSFWRYSHRECMVVCWYSSWYWESNFELLYLLYFFLMVTYWVTHVVFIMMPACRLSLHETASISRWVNAKYVYTNIYLTSSL